MLAPHPADETLGRARSSRIVPQGSIARYRLLDCCAGSHPEDTRRIAVTRREEARHAVGRLGAAATPTIWLEWRDVPPYPIDSKAFAHDADQFATLIRLRRIDAIALYDHSKTHCDHVVAYRREK